MTIPCVFGVTGLGGKDCYSLDIAGSLINSSNLAISEELLCQTLPDETHAAHPLNCQTRYPSGNLGSIQLSHGSVLDKVLAGLLLPGSVVDKSSRGSNLGVALSNLVLHALEITDEAAELLAVVPDVLGGVLESSEGETGHLGGDTDTSFVEDGDGVLVPLAPLAEEVLLGDLDVVEAEDASGGGADAEFLLLLGDFEAGCTLLNKEGGNTLVAFGGVEVGENDEEIGLHGVCDPHFPAGDLEAGVGLSGLGGHGEGIGARDGLRQTEGCDGAGGQLGEPLLLDDVGAVLEDDGIAEGVVYVDEDADGGIHAGELLDGNDGRGEVHAGAAKFLGDFNAHNTLLEKLLDNGRVHSLSLVHLAHLGKDGFIREFGDCFAHGSLSLGEVADGGWGNVGDIYCGGAQCRGGR